MTAEEFPVNPLVKAFYQMLDRVGLSPSGSFAYRRAEEINSALEGPLAEFPIDWIPGIEQYILDKGVTKIDTILTAMSAALKRGVPPDLPLADKDRQEASTDISDARIVQWLQSANGRLCVDGHEDCPGHGYAAAIAKIRSG